MCRVPKVIVVAPAGRPAELRRALSSLEYDIVAAVASAEEADGITADAAVVWEPDASTIDALRQRGVKTAAIGPGDAGEAIGPGDAGADMHLPPDDVAEFKTRMWELFAPR
jgi:hypothetical protein